MRTDALAVLAVLAMVALAGCAGNSGKASTAASGDPALGLLRGVVVDAAIRPIPGVAILVVPGDLNATTGADGQFALANVKPGDYTVTAGRLGYLDATTSARVSAGGHDPVLKLTLDLKPGGLKFANVYKFNGLFECSAWPTNGCANVNIATGIVLCQYHPVPCFNVTSDRSLFLQWVDPGLTYLQTELAWEPTLDAGRSLLFAAGGANQQELSSGFASAYNATEGESPLLLRITNHEGAAAWCKTSNSPPCPDQALNDSKIGTERALLVQVNSGATYPVPGGCVAYNPCGPGASFEQAFTCITTTFYGYEPPQDWLFATTGMAPPPPPS